MKSTNSKTNKYKHAVIAVDTVVFALDKNSLQVLLIQMKKKPYTKFWAAPGGLIGGAESLEKAVVRVLKNKTGMAPEYFEQLYTFGDVNRDPFGRVVSVAYLVPLQNLTIKIKTSGQYQDIKWFPIKKLPALAYDHRAIISKGLERLRAKLEYSNIACKMIPKDFTLTDLQKAYEIILDKKLDKRNFRKKIMALKLVKATKNFDTSKPNRPAQLFVAASSQVNMTRVLS